MFLRFKHVILVPTFGTISLAAKAVHGQSHCQAANAQANSEKIVLYQYQICPFCNMVKSYLDYSNTPYTAIEVNPISKSEIKFSTDYKKVPIATINGEVFVESRNIIERISKSSDSVGNKFFSDDSAHWMDWSEKRLAVMLYPNITRSFAESWECFGYAMTVNSWNIPMQYFTRFAGAVAMCFANGKIKKKHNIVDERAALNQEIQLWCTAIEGKKFLHGDYVSMPDVMVFGVLRAIAGLQTFNEIMGQYPALQQWYTRMSLEIPASP